MSAGDLLDQHVKHFDAEEYLAEFDMRQTRDGATVELFKGLCRMFHDVFSTHPPGERLLDVGSGPTLWHVMSASAKYKSIILSDPVPQNRHMQQMYMNDVSQDDRWTEHFKLTATLEGDEEKWREVGDRLRSSISDVIWCNVQEDHPFGEGITDDVFDCVMSSLCLEAACENIAGYAKAVKSLVSVAKPGAPIVMGGVLNQSFYEVGAHRFTCLPLTPDIIQDTLKAAGCTIAKFISSGERDVLADNEGIFVVDARKLYVI